jgi:SAM-dependent methyltransferase
LQKRITTRRHPREDIGRTLLGDVLEIGPGNAPFPTPPEARVTYADRSVAGGRDRTWPELVGQARGPDADIDLDLDLDGLGAIADDAFDVVVACHLIEHLADPIKALCEFERVLHRDGRLVLVVPDRTRTFDSVREPTPLAHLLDDFERQVTEVDAEHIREFCGAIFNQPPIHPDEVRDWHDPARLDDERLSLHRRRTIHVHCWTPEEFAVVIAGGLARGLMTWELIDLYFFDDAGDQPDNEFGLVLVRPTEPSAPTDQCVAFIHKWADLVLGDWDRDPARLVTLHSALLANLAGWDALAAVSLVVTEALGSRLVKERTTAASNEDRSTTAEAEAARLSERLRSSEKQLTEITGSRSYRASRLLGAWLRPFRRWIGNGSQSW